MSEAGVNNLLQSCLSIQVKPKQRLHDSRRQAPLFVIFKLRGNKNGVKKNPKQVRQEVGIRGGRQRQMHMFAPPLATKS